MNKKVEKFTKKLREALIESLMGYTADIRFYNVTLKGYDEDTTRDELAEVTRELGREQDKKGYEIRKGKGGIVPDKRDMKKIGELVKKQQKLSRYIDRMNEFRAKKMKTEEEIENRLRYIIMIDNPVKEFMKELDDISKL